MYISFFARGLLVLLLFSCYEGLSILPVARKRGFPIPFYRLAVSCLSRGSRYALVAVYSFSFFTTVLYIRERVLSPFISVLLNTEELRRTILLLKG